MGIRVKIRIHAESKSMATSALLSSSFETIEPTICIPIPLARRLGLWPSNRVITLDVITAGGEIAVYEVPEKVLVQLLDDNKVPDEALCTILVNPAIDEVLLSDTAIDSLGIIPVSFGRGFWRHKTDKPSTVRQSVKPEFWP